nr:ekc/keops complex subunit [Quercus suber]
MFVSTSLRHCIWGVPPSDAREDVLDRTPVAQLVLLACAIILLDRLPRSQAHDTGFTSCPFGDLPTPTRDRSYLALMETITLPHLRQCPLQVALFADVQNASFLRTQLLEGNSSFEYAFLDASAILSTTHVKAACFRAINDLLNDRLRSRNVHSEIVFSLSPNNNVCICLLRSTLAIWAK